MRWKVWTAKYWMVVNSALLWQNMPDHQSLENMEEIVQLVDHLIMADEVDEVALMVEVTPDPDLVLDLILDLYLVLDLDLDLKDVLDLEALDLMIKNADVQLLEIAVAVQSLEDLHLILAEIDLRRYFK